MEHLDRTNSIEHLVRLDVGPFCYEENFTHLYTLMWMTILSLLLQTTCFQHCKTYVDLCPTTISSLMLMFVIIVL